MKYKLGDIVSEIIDYRGKTPKKLGFDWSDSGIKALSAKNIKTGQIVQPETIRYVAEKNYPKWMKQEVERGTILVTSEAPFGQIFYWDSDEKIVLSQRLFAVKIKKEFDSKFVYYQMISEKFQNELSARATGSTVTGLRQPELMKCELDLPDLETQQKIVRILSTLDSKIELNNQQNQKMINIALGIYHDLLDKQDDSWKLGYIGDNKITRIVKSGVPKYLGTKRYVATADVSETDITHFEDVTFDEKPSRANMLPIDNTVWFAKMEGSTKNILVADFCSELQNNYIFSTGFMGIECLEGSLFYMWCYINDDKFLDTKNSLSTGTLMAGISNSTIQNAKCAVPPEELLNNFNRIVKPIFEKVHSNTVENESLTEIRDTLLPKLMNGEINLDDITL